MKLAGTRTKYRYSFPPDAPGQMFSEFTREPRTVVFGSVAHFPSRPAEFAAPPPVMRGRATSITWPPPPPLPDLPDGVWESKGVLMCECCVCEQAMPIECEPEDFNPNMAYCGGAPLCCP